MATDLLIIYLASVSSLTSTSAVHRITWQRLNLASLSFGKRTGVPGLVHDV